MVGLSILLKCNGLFKWVHNNLDNISFGKFEGFHTIVVLSLCMTPTATIGTDHVSSMPDGAEIESIAFTGHNFRMAHADSNPIRRGLFYFKGISFNISTFLQVRLHYSEFISRVIRGLDGKILNNFDILVLEGGGKLEIPHWLPDAFVNRLIQLFLIFFDGLIHLLYVKLHPFLHGLVVEG